MLIIGHRGAAGLVSENTLGSFKKAEDLGVDMIELDLRLSKDRQIVVIHDWSLMRLFRVSAFVSDLTVEQLKQISNNQIPTLTEVLAAVHTPLNLHVKVSGMEEQLLKQIKSFPHKVLISSVFPRILKKIKALDGNIQLGLIIGGPELRLMFILNWLVRDLNLYSIHPKNVLVSFATMPLFKWHKRKVIVWVVNRKRDFERLSKLKVDAIITDHPEKFI